MKRFFGFDSYRSYGGEPLQEKAVKAAINNKSILASNRWWKIPHVSSSGFDEGETSSALTIVISPLQSLMKDQVDNLEKIFVSTIHKAKGKEFDNVFLMLESFNLTTDEAKRHLYVAITRAKTNITIHLNSNFLDNLTADNLERVENKEIH